MVENNKIKEAFGKVKEDINDINSKLISNAHSIDSVKSNTQEWIISIMERQAKIEQELLRLNQKINNIEETKMRWV